jgi:EpsI family protein
MSIDFATPPLVVPLPHERRLPIAWAGHPIMSISITAWRFLVLSLSLVLSGTAISWVRSIYNVELDPPAVPLTSIPLKLGDWSGQEVEIRPETIRVIGAQSFINRLYRDARGREVSLHAAAFTDPQFGGGAPHHPEVCYPAAGWDIIERQTTTIRTPAGELPVQYMLFQKGSDRVVSAHWYQAGDLRFTGSLGLQSQLFRFWGAESRPCTEKFLVQVGQPSIAAAQPILQQFIESLEVARAGIPGGRP